MRPEPARSAALLRGLGLCLVLAAPMGCFSDEGFGLDVEDESGEAETGEDGASEIPCTGDLRCEAAPPEGWDGPALRWRGDPADTPACPELAPHVWALGGEALTADPLSCACSCETTSEVECGGVALEMFSFSDCSGAATHRHAIAAGACRTLGTGSGSGARAAVDPISADALECAAKHEVLERPEVRWTQAHLLCGTAREAGQCAADERCLPRAADPMDRGSCIFRPGDHPCPSTGPWIERTLIHEDWRDERACDGCSCGAPELGACGAEISIFTDDACTTPHPAGSVGDACAPMSGYAPRSAWVLGGEGTTPLSCASEGTPGSTGEVRPSEALTVCCGG